VRSRNIHYQLGVKSMAVGQRHFDLAGIMDDMTISEDEPVRCEEEPGAIAVHLRGKVWTRRRPISHRLMHFNTDYGWTYFLHRLDNCLGIGIKQSSLSVHV